MKATFVIGLVTALSASSLSPAFADAKADATLGRLGKACKERLMGQFPGVPSRTFT